ncbi:MAG TPA: EAL domain-containing protein [Arenimonas sp.]|uniref:EAL domain-containing protein n=1 Tax=Arenimonas sp. TaxID=1872635 RepID=UPI002D7ED868|nr:EAL domain-containing protein [Arenimonas sp.]HEU0153247.1 EAL domain-containing protein [Arenimonas sp.]
MSHRILIVDDNPTNLRLAASVLELDGHAVDHAADAEEALRYLADRVPDLILMDIALPGMDGLTLTRQLKRDERLGAVPVVALTAFAMKGDDDKAREAGCAGYLTKPIDTREFGRQVAAFLPMRRAMTLLIVDDNATNLRLLAAQLAAEGHRTLQACHGEDALEVLARTPVDGVISDILMPRMDGYRLCLAVRKQPQFAAMPFILYTSTYNSPADRSLARAAGADAYIAKPAPVRVLLESLASAAAKERPAVPVTVAELEDPVLKQYSESLIRKLEEKSTQLGLAYEGLAQTEARLAGLVESALDAIIALDGEQKIVLFNAAAEKMFGCSRQQALHEPIGKFIPERFRDAHVHQVDRFAGGEEDGRRMGARTVFALRADGEEFPVEASISRMSTSQGWLFTVFLRDITERHRAEQALIRSDARLRRLNRVLSVLSGINNLIVRANDKVELLDQSCRIAVESGHFLKAWIGLLDKASGTLDVRAAAGGQGSLLDELNDGLAASGVLEGPWADAIRASLPVVYNEVAGGHALLEAAAAAGTRSLAALPLSLDGEAVGVLVLHAAEPGFFDAEEMTLLTELAGDITYALDHLGKSERLRYLAQYDALTGLPNRSLFSELVTRSLQARHDAGYRFTAVMLVDIERFRRVNETLGREVGDQILGQVAARLRGINDDVARLGEDVFALKFSVSDVAQDCLHEFNAMVQACFTPPYPTAGGDLRMGCRAGVAVHPSDGEDAEALLRNAEAALRRARMSSERLVFYAPEFNARAAEALGLESKLRQAIDRREFVLHYQPKVSITDRRIVGLEALIRWQDPEQGLVAPGRFIPVLEECGLIGEVGDWALRQALADQAAWWNLGLVAPRVAVNVSPLQLRKPGFANEIVDLAAEKSTTEIELEITESVIMDNVDANILALKTVRAAGVTVAIDDFGTGYCSLAYVARLPVNSLKIDRTFIVGMTEGPEGLAIVSSIIALAHALRLKVVAEGVETEEQARLLHLLRCDEAQGYLFSRPVPAAAITLLLRRGNQPLPVPG